LALRMEYQVIALALALERVAPPTIAAALFCRGGYGVAVDMIDLEL